MSSSNQYAEIRPAALSDRQDKVIQLVARYVSESADATRYQHTVRSKTNHNMNFSFLDPIHSHHSYYNYLVDAYRSYRESYVQAYYYQQVNTGATYGGGYTGATYSVQQEPRRTYDATEQPAVKQRRTESVLPAPQVQVEEDDEPNFDIVCGPDGVQRVVRR